MITGAIINIFYSVIAFLIGILPTGDLGIPQAFIDGLNLIVQYVYAWDWLLPVGDLLAAFVTVVGFYAILMLVKTVLWIIRTIRGSGS
jgi:hypothetical protein